ncbi:hypothetical protein AGLY_011533, partial [Aphis glycines]
QVAYGLKFSTNNCFSLPEFNCNVIASITHLHTETHNLPDSYFQYSFEHIWIGGYQTTTVQNYFLLQYGLYDLLVSWAYQTPFPFDPLPRRNYDLYLFSVDQNCGYKWTDTVDRMTQHTTAISNGDPIMQTASAMVQIRLLFSTTIRTAELGRIIQLRHLSQMDIPIHEEDIILSLAQWTTKSGRAQLREAFAFGCHNLCFLPETRSNVPAVWACCKMVGIDELGPARLCAIVLKHNMAQ